MKVKTLIRFTDLKENAIREVGEVFEVNKARFAEISAISSKPLIAEIEVGKKPIKLKSKVGD